MASFLDTLHSEHEMVKELFEKIEKSSSDTSKARLFGQLKQDLELHMKGEEKYFYPALEEQEKYKEDVLEGFEEHHAAKLFLEEIDNMSPDEEHWDAKVSVLKEMVDHHVEEEESTIFEHAREGLSEEQLRKIAERFESEKAGAGGKKAVRAAR